MRHSLLMSVIMAVTACSSAGNTAREEQPEAYLSGEALRATGAANVEAAVWELRPTWMRSGRESAGVARNGAIEVCKGDHLVYLDGRRVERALNQVSLVDVIGVRYIRPGGVRPDGARTCRALGTFDVITRQ